MSEPGTLGDTYTLPPLSGGPRRSLGYHNYRAWPGPKCSSCVLYLGGAGPGTTPVSGDAEKRGRKKKKKNNKKNKKNAGNSGAGKVPSKNPF